MVIEFPIGETQRNEQNRLSREWCRGLAGHAPSAEIISFRNWTADDYNSRRGDVAEFVAEFADCDPDFTS